MTRHRVAFVVFLTAAISPPLAAYNLAGYQWAEDSTSFRVNISGNSPSGQSWSSAFNSAATQWNTKSSFDFNVSDGGGDPCAVPTGRGDVNVATFSETKCGSSFGGSTLAITRNWSVGGDLVQSGIIFNDADVSWDVYSGAWQGTSRADFRRVAVHELGHAMGLSHSSGGIMNAFAGNTETPQSDDIAGVAALYGGTSTSGDDGGSGGGDDGGSGGGDDGGSGGGDDGGSGGGDDGGTGGGSGGSGGSSGGTGGSSGGTGGGSGGTRTQPPAPLPDRIFAVSFESDSAVRGKSVLAADDGTLVAYEPDSQRILIHDPAAGGLREVTVAGSGRVSLVQGDFDGDGATDVGTFRAIDGLWTIYPGSGEPFWQYRLGGPGDVAVPDDYDGDGRTDLATWSPATGEWAIRPAGALESFSVKLGQSETDVPVPADYTGDGRTDLAVWSPSSAEWRILDLTSGFGLAYALPAESAGRLKVAPGDYDGDGRADPALFDDATGTWTIRTSRWAENRIQQMPAAATGKAAPSDYDGDGITDMAWWHNGQLTIALSGSGEQVTRSLRGIVPLATRLAPVDTDLRAAVHDD